MSDVYFTSMRVKPGGDNLLVKLKKLVFKAKIADINMKGKFVAIKMHFGEYGNLAFLRPNFAKVVADVVKELGGKPFLCDCNTLYTGGRYNALDHLKTAEMNGFNSVTTGCNVIIGDGLKGTDEVDVAVKNGQLVKTAHIGRALYDADVIISLAHFKGHEGAGFGGAIKNLGMGGASQAGKRDQHSKGLPQVVADKCIGCKLCLSQCNHSAISFSSNKAQIDNGRCAGCGRCIGVCSSCAIVHMEKDANISLNKKMAEYTMAIVQDKPNFSINIIMDVSPYCDCHRGNDTPVIADVGMLASFDPVALDQASADLCNKQTPLPGTYLSDRENNHSDHFDHMHPDTNWHSQISHAEEIGLGSAKYRLIEC